MSRKRNVAPSEVFLSHSSQNGTFTKRLADVLAAHGVKTFLSKVNIRSAQAWHDEIGNALHRCDWFIVVLSPQSVASRWVKYELIYVLQENRYKDRIIPVLHRNCDAGKLSWTLSALQWVDFRGNFDEGCRALLSVWGLKYLPRL